ncbi:unnamed protein product [Ixodes persulcatus]
MLQRGHSLLVCLAGLTTRPSRGIPNAKVEIKSRTFAEMPGPRHALGLRVYESIIRILGSGRVIPGPLDHDKFGKERDAEAPAKARSLTSCLCRRFEAKHNGYPSRRR